MSKAAKMWLAAAVFFIISGVLIFAAAMAAVQWDFRALDTTHYQADIYRVADAFSSISVQTETADITFAAAADGYCEVVCYDAENVNYTVTVRGNTLVIDSADERKWYEHIGIMFKMPKVTIYLPQKEYGVLTIQESTGDIELPGDFIFESIDISVSTGDVHNCASALGLLKIETTTGDIQIENVTANACELLASTGDVSVRNTACTEDMSITVSTGKAEVCHVQCRSFISDGSTGEIFMENTVAAEHFRIERSTGDVSFEGCDAAELYIKTDTGDISGGLLSGKTFFAQSDTGSVRVPKTGSGGMCELITDTGDISIDPA